MDKTKVIKMRCPNTKKKKEYALAYEAHIRNNNSLTSYREVSRLPRCILPLDPSIVSYPNAYA